MNDEPEQPDMDYLSASSYADGDDTVRVAQRWVRNLLDAHTSLLDRRGDAPLPGWEDMTHDALARKILGRLLDAGWRPPSDMEIAAAADWVSKKRRRYDWWWRSLTDDERARFVKHYSEYGEPPSDLRPPS